MKVIAALRLETGPTTVPLIGPNTIMRSPRIAVWMGLLLAVRAVVTTSAWSQTSVPPPGTIPCAPADAPAGYGSFIALKTAKYLQTPGADPIESSTTNTAVAAFFLSAPEGYAVGNGRVAGPLGFSTPLGPGENGLFFGATNFPSESALNAAAPAGAWLSQFLLGPTNGASYVAFFPFTLTSTTPPVPTVVNVAAAQAVNPSAAFRIEWNAWTTAAPGDRISVTIETLAGFRVWEFATDCVATLDPIGTLASVEIPANVLTASSSYTVSLTFASRIHDSIDAATRMVKRGFQSRTTQFPLVTASSAALEIGTISDIRLSDGRIFLVVGGTPRTNYWVQSSLDGTNWVNVLNVYLPINGRASVSFAAPADGLAREYRAILESSILLPLEPASLALVRVNATQMRLTLRGTPGATYSVEWSTNWITWQPLFFQGITLPLRPPGGINPPPGATFGQFNFNIPFVRNPGLRVYRATTVRGP